MSINHLLVQFLQIIKYTFEDKLGEQYFFRISNLKIIYQFYRNGI